MSTTKILSVLTLILIPMANVSTVIASQDNKDDNTNMSDTLNLSGSSPLSDISEDGDSNNNSDAEEENNSNTTVVTKVQQDPFVCDELMVEDAEEQSQNDSFTNDVEVIVGYMSLHTDNTNN